MNTQHVKLSMVESNNLSTYIDLNIGTVPKFPIFNNSSESLKSVFGYDFNSFDQTTTGMPWSHEGGIQTSDIDPSLVLPLDSAFHGTIPSTYSPTFLAAQTFGSFADSSSGSADAFTQNAASSLPVSQTQNRKGVKKRQTRKKKAPLSPAVKEERRRAFLERNRKAARKCRDKNRQRWDRLHEHCLDLEAQNTVFKERRLELEADVERLSKLVREHRECGDDEMRKWVAQYEVDEIRSELGRENDVMVPALESPSMSQEESTGLIQEDRGEEEHDIAAAVDSRISPNTGKSAIAPLHTDIEFDMSSFIADENNVPSLSSSRKTSATSTEFEFEFDLILPRNVPSRADFAVDLIAEIATDGKMDEMKQGEKSRLLGSTLHPLSPPAG